jgi:hypothetical protein
VSLAIAITTAKAGDFFVTKEQIFVFRSEQDCPQWIAAQAKQTQQIIDTGVLPAGSELTVENVGSNGIDKVRLKGYPMDLFTPNLLGFRPSK